MAKRNKDNMNGSDLALGVVSLLLVIIAVIIIFGFLGSGGEGGNMLYATLFEAVGYYAALLPLLLAYIAYKLWNNELPAYRILQYIGFVLLTLSVSGIAYLYPAHNLSGELGKSIFENISKVIGIAPAAFILILVVYLSLMLMLGRKNVVSFESDNRFFAFLSKINIFRYLYNFIFETKERKMVSAAKVEAEQDEDEEEIEEEEEIIEMPKTAINKSKPRANYDEDIIEDDEPLKAKKDINKNIKFLPPPIDLLNGDSGKSSAGDTRTMAKAIENVLHDFEIDVEMSGATVGPTVTQYRIKPPQGVPVRKILSLKDDIQLALSVNNIHIEAPIPGKPYVGIEVPNKEKQTLGLRTMFEDEGFKNSNNLTVAIGRSITNKPVYADIENMPHLLIAGATKSGKSVTVQNILMSLLYKNSPDDLKLVVIDPKKVEFTLYKNLPHLGTPVIADPKNAIKCLNWAINEMERRYEYFAENYAGIQNLADYNRKIYNPSVDKNKKRIIDDEENMPEKLPFIVIIFDEFNDFMLSYPKEITTAITSLTQKGRAAGIHLILATQRPDVKVITGTIKANIPARIALKTSSSVDSRTILDATGAEDLLGKGDMLFMEPGEPRPVRVQAPFVSSEEIESVINYIKERYYDYNGNVIDYSKAKDSISAASIGSGRSSGNEDDEEDEDYVKAREYVVMTQRASASGLQSKFGWGFPKANGMIMKLEDNKVVTPLEGNKRQVLLKLEDLQGSQAE